VSPLLNEITALLGLPAEQRSVEHLTEICLTRLQGPDEPAVVRALCDLQDLRVSEALAGIELRTRRISACERGLARLRTAHSSTQLIERVCDELVRSCGLERVLLSRVEDGTWRPWMVNDVVQTEDWFAAWADRVIPLGEFILETELLAERGPALITDTDDVRIHPIIRAGYSTSYLVAPILAVGEVVGFFHADHGIGGPPCSETDREVLWTFAQGFAHLYERRTLLERLSEQRARVRETLSAVDAALRRLHDSDIALAAADDPSEDDSRDRSVTGLADLTAREREVLEALATGANNQQIAARFVIGESTVKSHVKHILRKLEVHNRSQAIAVLLEQQR
jgi:DNA-binding CsgD family transcriptional regulator